MAERSCEYFFTHTYPFTKWTPASCRQKRWSCCPVCTFPSTHNVERYSLYSRDNTIGEALCREHLQCGENDKDKDPAITCKRVFGQDGAACPSQSVRSLLYQAMPRLVTQLTSSLVHPTDGYKCTMRKVYVLWCELCALASIRTAYKADDDRRSDNYEAMYSDTDNTGLDIVLGQEEDIEWDMVASPEQEQRECADIGFVLRPLLQQNHVQLMRMHLNRCIDRLSDSPHLYANDETYRSGNEVYDRAFEEWLSSSTDADRNTFRVNEAAWSQCCESCIGDGIRLTPIDPEVKEYVLSVDDHHRWQYQSEEELVGMKAFADSMHTQTLLGTDPIDQMHFLLEHLLIERRWGTCEVDDPRLLSTFASENDVLSLKREAEEACRCAAYDFVECIITEVLGHLNIHTSWNALSRIADNCVLLKSYCVHLKKAVRECIKEGDIDLEDMCALQAWTEERCLSRLDRILRSTKSCIFERSRGVLYAQKYTDFVWPQRESEIFREVSKTLDAKLRWTLASARDKKIAGPNRCTGCLRKDLQLVVQR